MIASVAALFPLSAARAANYGVFVAVEDYTVCNDLRYTIDDMADFKSMLQQVGDWDPSNMITLTNSAATESGIEDAIYDMADEESAGDLCIFAFSGHGGGGGPTCCGDPGLVPYDDTNLVTPGELEYLLSSLDTDKLVVILDCCHSAYFNTIDFGVTITACDTDEHCAEFPALQNGAFSYFVAEGMSGWADFFGAALSAEEIFAHADPKATSYNPNQDGQQFDDYAGALDVITKTFTTSGSLSHSEIWSGEVDFAGNVTVGSGCTLTVLNDSPYLTEVWLTSGENKYSLAATGTGVIVEDDEETYWKPVDVAVKSGTSLKGQYASIQSAITAASSGQKVWIDPGTYYEQLYMKDGVSLEGNDWGSAPTVCGGPSGTAASFYNTDGVDIKYMRFTGLYNLVEISGGTDLYFEDVEVEGNAYAGLGVYISSGADPTFNGLTIHTCSSKGVHSSGAYGYIYNSDIHGNAQGVYCSSGADPELTGGNDFYSNSSYDVHATSNCPSFNAMYCNWDDYNESGPTQVLHDGAPTYTIDVFGWSGYPKLAATVAENPNQGWEWYASGKEKIRKGDLRGALEDFKRIVEWYPHADVGRFALNRTVLVHSKLGEYANAIAYLERVAAQHEGEEIGVRALFLTARCLIAEEKYPEALARCDLVLSRYPDSGVCPSALIEKAGVHFYGLGDKAKGKAVFAEVAARYPGSDEAEFALRKIGSEPPPQVLAAEEAATSELAVYPNPSNPSTTIQFSLPSTGKVSLAIYNALGQQVAVLADGVREAGAHSVVWDGRDERGMALASGLYFARLQTAQSAQTRRMLLLK